MKKKRLVKLWQSLAILISLGFLFGSVSVVWAITLPIPDFDQFFQERIISQSTKIYDRSTGIITYGKVPEYSVVVPGNLPSSDGTHSTYAAIIVKKVDAKTRSKISINELLRE